MYSIKDISGYLQKEAGLSDTETAIVKYALEVMRTTAAGLISIILLAWLLGVLKYALFATLAMSCYRILAGGAHSVTVTNCSLTGAVVSSVIGLFAKFNNQIPHQILFFTIISIFLFSLISVWQYAPADTPSKPIIRPRQKQNLRILSFIYVIGWAVMSILALAGKIHIEVPIIIALSLGVFWQSFTLRPAGYRFIKKIDDVLPK